MASALSPMNEKEFILCKLNDLPIIFPLKKEAP
jgi:hypothetical protein